MQSHPARGVWIETCNILISAHYDVIIREPELMHGMVEWYPRFFNSFLMRLRSAF